MRSLLARCIKCQAWQHYVPLKRVVLQFGSDRSGSHEKVMEVVFVLRDAVHPAQRGGGSAAKLDELPLSCAAQVKSAGPAQYPCFTLTGALSDMT